MARPRHDAFGQQVGKGAVDRRVRLAENERQFRRIDEGRPAEGVEQLSFGKGHKVRLPAHEIRKVLLTLRIALYIVGIQQYVSRSGRQ